MKAEHSYRNYPNTSKLASDIEKLLSRKRELSGSHCNNLSYSLSRIDRFLSGSEFDSEVLSKQAVEAFVSYVTSQTLSPGAKGIYLGAVKELALYQLEMGKDAFYWQETIQNVAGSYRRPYIPSDEEFKKFGVYLNHYLVVVPLKKRHLDLCYAVMVRLYSLCGLRNSEATDLLREEVRFSDNTLYIRHSKGDKDRIVPVSDEVAALLKRCDEFLEQRFPNRKYFFVNQKGGRHRNTCVDKWFNHHWQACFGEKSRDQRPTIQDLRHTFVVRCIDSWGGEAGADFGVKFPLLSKYIGHSSVQETMYYYHAYKGLSQLAEGWIMSCNSVAKGVCDALLK